MLAVMKKVIVKEIIIEKGSEKMGKKARLAF